MIVCWNCHLEQYDGTIFCAGCGVHIAQAQQPAVPEAPAAADSRVVDDAPMIQETANEVIELRLKAHLKQSLLVGRSDTKRGVVPDIDLNPYGGRDAGVSRRHAVLQLCNGAYTVEDLDSANGTYLNQQRVPPRQAIAFRSGDELRLGLLRVRVAVEEQQIGFEG